MRLSKIIRRVLMGVLVGMLVVRSGVFAVRIVREWNQPRAEWLPANENEQMIWENFIYIDSGSGPE